MESEIKLDEVEKKKDKKPFSFAYIITVGLSIFVFIIGCSEDFGNLKRNRKAIQRSHNRN